MSDPKKPEKPIEITDEMLGVLLRWIDEAGKGEVEWPSDEMIIDYLRSTASENERNTVIDAMKRSPEFFRRVLSAAKGLAYVESIDLDQIQTNNGSSTLIMAGEAKPSFFERLVRSLKSKRFQLMVVPVAAVVLIAAVMLVRHDYLSRLVSLFQEKERIQVTVNVVHTTGTVEFDDLDRLLHYAENRILRYEDSKGIKAKGPTYIESKYNLINMRRDPMALAKYNLALLFLDKNIDTPKEILNTAIKYRLPITIQLVDSIGSKLSGFSTQLASGKKERPDSIIAWALNRTTRKLYPYHVDGDTVQLLWIPEMGKEIPMIFTYKLGNYYVNSEGKIINIGL
jgi:hypothetical protein